VVAVKEVEVDAVGRPSQSPQARHRMPERSVSS
jgi:hypothetical protein